MSQYRYKSHDFGQTLIRLDVVLSSQLCNNATIKVRRFALTSDFVATIYVTYETLLLYLGYKYFLGV